MFALHILVQKIPNAIGHVSRQRDVMQLFVRNSAGETVTLDVLPSESIARVLSKSLIRFKEGTGQHRHSLFFGGTPLQSGRRLSDYNVFNHASLQLLTLLFGGMDNASTNPARCISPPLA